MIIVNNHANFIIITYLVVYIIHAEKYVHAVYVVHVVHVFHVVNVVHVVSVVHVIHVTVPLSFGTAKSSQNGPLRLN